VRVAGMRADAPGFIFFFQARMLPPFLRIKKKLPFAQHRKILRGSVGSKVTQKKAPAEGHRESLGEGVPFWGCADCSTQSRAPPMGDKGETGPVTTRARWAWGVLDSDVAQS
jgi:hypothetical protein